ncbi:MAG: FecR domain-containing protein [Acidobacteria bacterium]|nr:FecR domain-containing protein [Acidobacteriota bacterium]
MSEDRLDKALEAMKSEDANATEIASAHDRVWERLQNPGESLCGEFRLQFQDYVDGRLDDGRRMLMEDHLSRCPSCRTKLAALKGERQATVIPMRRSNRWPRWGKWSAIAAVIMAAVYLGRAQLDALIALGSPRATVVSLNGDLHRVPQGILKAGSEIGQDEVVRTSPGARAVLRLADGSLVDVNERTELSVHAAWSGKVVHLARGDVIVQAAKQRHGYLRVQTRDSIASVKGTIFAVSSGISGSLVSVVEGSVAVAQSGAETVLSPGEQTASNPALIGSVEEAVSWSPDAETYVAILASLANIEKQIAALPSQPSRTESKLLQLLPPNTIIYGAIPNIGETIGQAMGFADQQSSENPAFGQWWNSSSGQSLKQLISRVETVTHFFGREIVFGFSLGTPGTNEKVPMILAEIQPGRQADLAAALSMLSSQMGQASFSYNLTDSLMVFSDSPAHLQWLQGNMGQSGATPFTEAIAQRYQRGVGWMLAMDMDSMISLSASADSTLAKEHQVKHLFLERHEVQGTEDNEMAITFKGPRMGMASFLANSGSTGAAEYISGDAIAAAYISTREPRQMFDEMMALISRSSQASMGQLAEAEAKLGISFGDDFAASLGTESAFGLENITLTGPVWVMAGMVHDPAKLESTIQKLVDVANAELARQGKTEQLILSRETIDGRTWTTLKPPKVPASITWTYDEGYIVAGSDRGVVLKALTTRHGGSPLIYSAAFQQQLSPGAGLHPSGFAWLNTKGALQGLANMATNPAIRNLIAERDPILVTFSATTEQIRAASRTRLSGLIMDIMLLQGLSQLRTGSQPAAL